MNKLIIKNFDKTKIMILDFDELDFGFGIGDYYYNGKCKGSQIGFYWNEELGQEYVEHLFFSVYVGNEDENDIETLHRTLKNLTPNDRLLITLSNEDYKTFMNWYNETNTCDFHFYNKEEIDKIEKGKEVEE